jgi:hypothetical protein
MINLIKKWWRPSKFYVTYCKTLGMGCDDNQDKFSYNNLEEAKARLNHLNSLDREGLLLEGFNFVPNYMRILQVTSPNPLRRFLNWRGSKRLYNVFGFKI